MVNLGSSGVVQPCRTALVSPLVPRSMSSSRDVCMPAAARHAAEHSVRRAAAAALSALVVLSSGGLVPELAPAPAFAATDGAAIGACLITKKPLPLARCIADPTCLANLACIQTCTNRPDESECQIKCGDEFSNDVVGAFTKAAVSDSKCVPQRQDDGAWPVPPESALVSRFSTEQLEGDWYISAGLNKAFDTFDCQLHKFTAPTPTKLVGNLQWRIKDPIAGSNFVTRYTVQEFVQDEKQPGVLYNHDNEFLHYEDDWYVLAAKPQQYVLVYYRGNNDAWDGYGGAVVYTKEPALPKQYIPELRTALAQVNLKWDDFALTDNSCKAPESRLEEFEKDLVFVEARAAQGLQVGLKEVAKDALAVEQEVVKDLVIAEKEVVKDVRIVEREVVKDAIAVEKEVVKDALAVEKEAETDLKGLASVFSNKKR